MASYIGRHLVILCKFIYVIGLVNNVTTRSGSIMLIDSLIIIYRAFQRCRWVKRVSNRGETVELLAFVNDVLSVVEQQGKFLIDVSEG
jgi:hypothetical protein